MRVINIDGTDVFLDNKEFGRGKITISGPYVNASHFWGAMGSTLEEFLLDINEDYFINKLGSEQGVFDPRATVTNIRKSMRQMDAGWEIPWYQFPEAQKELRGDLRYLACEENEYRFYDQCKSISKKYWGQHFDNKTNQTEFEENLSALLEESHYFFEYKESETNLFLKKLFKKLQKSLRA